MKGICTKLRLSASKYRIIDPSNPMVQRKLFSNSFSGEEWNGRSEVRRSAQVQRKVDIDIDVDVEPPKEQRQQQQ